MTAFLFDVDGTLTPSRQPIDPKFKSFFLGWLEDHDAWLVTGSDYAKTLEQLGEEICHKVCGIFTCSGNEFIVEGSRVAYNDWTLPEMAHEYLASKLITSEFPLRCDRHFEHRTGMVNFSIVGRGATLEERQEYIKWDKTYNERKNIARQFNRIFPELEAKVGGETGLDISPKGFDKRQILKHFDTSHVVFFGDAMSVDGNDFPLADALIVRGNCDVYPVTSWIDTFNRLDEIYD